MSLLNKLVRVEVLNLPIVPARSGIKDGRPWSIPALQKCAIHTGGPFAVKLEIPAPETSPYRPGIYFLSGDCLTEAAVNVGGNARLRVSFSDREVVLIPFEEVAAAFAAEASSSKPRAAA